ncbi:response regulator [Mucilaginibacter sp. UR6-1]|uniref:ATP-binding protein n=1 Tax=Mucilaginibacter sp. UR6-1 TaxID=1435643 RepID=UPI001E65726A|nr:ATP-binding protein [Mucilaginibacter sp. UR6-1]MCC8409936.1 response regulator [Mucilaginibacter sp. UR6-1]
MSNPAGIFNFSLKRILNSEQSLLDQARIKLLYYGLVFVAVAMVLLLASINLTHQPAIAITSTALLVSVLVMFKYLTYKPDWASISHGMLIIGSFITLGNVFVILQDVNMITVQIIILIVVFSFYMLGHRWGIFYSLANLLPVLGFLVLQYKTSYIISFRPEKIDPSTMIICVFANFLLTIFVISHFYNAFVTNMRQLKNVGDEQSQLNSKLELAMQKAEKSSHAKSEFLSTMSHEIRTPLNAVIGMTNLLLMNSPRPDQKENLDILKFSAANLLSIVNDVLDFNKIESGKVSFEHIRMDLTDLLNNICGGFIIKAEEKGLLFKLDIDSRLKNKVFFGDPTRITQIIFNLVSNAIKFTQQGNVWVRATCVEDRHNTSTVLFSVKDTGIGIAQNNLQAIFEPFAQENITVTRQYGGTGLGLAIVKRLLELQGLQLSVNSKPGVGSEFSFSMAFETSTEAVEAAVAPKPVPDANDLSHLQVLIAEDNIVNVMLMKKLLSKWKIVPTIAENGAMAVQKLQYGNFDIVLMDLQMPVMDGFEAAREIRRLTDPKKANTPIIALTASALFDIQEQVYASGMNNYVSKPFKPEDLFEKMQSLVSIAG